MAEQPKGSDQERQELTFVEKIESFHELVRQCRTCQEEVEPHWQFCASCGVRQATACPRCEKPLPPAGAQSCPHCGLEIPRIDS